ncbi:MAG TPA: M23 family metallopeptidase, partial [Thermomicrobiales bacterium]
SSDKKPGVTPPPNPLQDPYSGAIALTFPLADGAYHKSLRDGWHDNRVGDFAGSWSHQNSTTQRAHDGVDIFPQSAKALPTVYAPLAARVAAVCVGGVYTQNRDAVIAPPWSYPAGTGADNIYGNYLWLYSTELGSLGYFAFYCHLQDDGLLRAVAAELVSGSDAVGVSTAVGTMGDTGNAAGQPQLHVELHYPRGNSFQCARCAPAKGGMTAFNPFPSLSRATLR